MKKSDEIREKISKKEEQIEKRKKITEKLETKRHGMGEKLEKQGVILAKTGDDSYRMGFSYELRWNIMDYHRMAKDIIDSVKKQAELEWQLLRLQEQLEQQLNKENVPKIEAIETLLDKWEERMQEFIQYCYEENQKRRAAYTECREALNEALGIRHSQTYYHFKNDAKYNRMKDEELKEKYTSQDGRYQVSEENYHSMVATYNRESQYENFSNEHRIFLELYGDKEKTERFMRNEKEARRIDLINRVTDTVGEIVDATHLSFGMNDGINGVVVGKKGKANVQTIDAGGHNIQRYHYRVLVHPIRENNKPSIDTCIAEAKQVVENNNSITAIRKNELTLEK